MLKIYSSGKPFRFSVLLIAISLLLLSGCASTSPNNAKFTEPLLKDQYLDANDTASVKVEVSNNVIIEEHEKQRLAKVLLKEINEQKILNIDSADKREYKSEIFMTRYDKGNAFARAMLAALGTCTSMTIRIYANHKGWLLENIQVQLGHTRHHSTDCENCENANSKVETITRTIKLTGPLDGKQHERMMEIANRCPVHRTIESDLRIETVSGA